MKFFDSALDSLSVQLNSLKVLEVKFKKDFYDKEQERLRANDPQEILRKQMEEKQQQELKKEVSQNGEAVNSVIGINENEPDIMDDINDFLNKVPDTSEFNFGDNIQSFIDNGEEGDLQKFSNNGGEYGNSNSTSFTVNDAMIGDVNPNLTDLETVENNSQDNNGFQDGGNYDFEEQNNFLEDIDSMLNL